ncbi:glycerol-3-phosphate dehydrogenase [Rhodopila sp.]|jgi:glycerol-3-phosphate dehydrogenase|uniref:glycerol-3-phosphate dehydrogenase n=1 Tax=Rhodopila sp. TaxID=2480087 RepID=UPI002BE82147|nr:glycerol-3-phosphate dehydrogenase [Rhodopila sp.]HVZ09102.1 glycerol-3-phosphate dehydrogenase [Rhodopila sp.]
MAELDHFDIAIIGGGINGCGIARDAAGRGHRVFLCDKGDLASGTSSASTKLIHGGLRYLEHYEFRLVREALMEREVLWGIAPHIIRPLRFILPHHHGLRPAWMLRLGLFLYDHLGGRRRLPPTRTLRLRDGPSGRLLKPEFTRGFEYSDCRVDDARLVVLNARDAADRGAEIAPRTRCLSAERKAGTWHLMVRHEITGRTRLVTATALVNATGPWVAQVAAAVIRANVTAKVRLVQGSHIVVPRLYDHSSCYIFQNADGRILFVIPYEQDFTLIGTTDQDFDGDPDQVHASAEEIAYLCRSASTYLRKPVTPEMAVWSYSGIRPLFDDGSGDPSAATRDYVLRLDAPEGAPALLSVFGGKITTYRRLAEHALGDLATHLPAATGEQAGWTGRTALPGGDFATDGFDALVSRMSARFPLLPATTLHRLCHAYGTHVPTVLASGDVNTDLGAGLTDAELRYLMSHEWAMTVGDVAWRRSKLGLRLSAAEMDGIGSVMRDIAGTRTKETAHGAPHPGH